MGKEIKNLWSRHPDADLWRDLLKSVVARKQAFYFRAAVDHVALKIPHYVAIVKTPMDLGTVESKLARNAYQTDDAFVSDVRLVFSNAMLFNTNKAHQVHVAARALSVFFEARVGDLRAGRLGAGGGTRARTAASSAPRPGAPRSTRGAAGGARNPASAERSARARSASPRPPKGGGAKKPPRGGGGGGGGARPTRAAPNTPRNGLVPAAQLAEMAEKMATLRRELDELRRVVRGAPPAADAAVSSASESDGGDDDDGGDGAASPDGARASSEGSGGSSTASSSVASRPRPRLRFRVPARAPRGPSSPEGAAGLSGSDGSTVSLAGSSPGPRDTNDDADASLDGAAGDDGLSAEQAAAYASAIVEMTDDDEDGEVGVLTGRGAPPSALKRRDGGGGGGGDADRETPQPSKRGRWIESPADVAAFSAPPAALGRLFRGASDILNDDVAAVARLKEDVGSTSPLWSLEDHLPRAPTPAALDLGAE